jgi:trehalose 6-phosphate phosphatase
LIGRVEPADLVDRVRPLLKSALIATDFDGTLAPLVLDPQQSRPVAGAVDALAALAGRGARVAVITGRDAETVVRLGGLQSVPGLSVQGLYGLEAWEDGVLESPDTPEAMIALRDRLPAAVDEAGADPAVWIEDKRLSLVVHTRRAEHPAQELARLGQPVQAVASQLGLEVHPGSDVLEIRLPGYDKAAALHTLVERHSPRVVVYLGDDLGDLPAFAEVRRLRDGGLPAYGVGVLASRAEGVTEAADVMVADAEAVVQLLWQLANGQR